MFIGLEQRTEMRNRKLQKVFNSEEFFFKFLFLKLVGGGVNSLNIKHKFRCIAHYNDSDLGQLYM